MAVAQTEFGSMQVGAHFTSLVLSHHLDKLNICSPLILTISQEDSLALNSLFQYRVKQTKKSES